MKARIRSSGAIAEWMLGCQLAGIEASKSCVEELSRALELALLELDEFMKDELIRPVWSGKVMET